MWICFVAWGENAEAWKSSYNVWWFVNILEAASFCQVFTISDLWMYIGRKAFVVCSNDSCKEKTFHSLCSHGFQLAGLIMSSSFVFFFLLFSILFVDIRVMHFLSGPSAFTIFKRNPQVPSRGRGVLTFNFYLHSTIIPMLLSCFLFGDFSRIYNFSFFLSLIISFNVV